MEESYGKRLNRASWLEFRKCWSGYLILRTLSGIGAPIIPLIARGFNSMLSLAEAVESAAFGAFASILLTYLYSRRKGAEALDIGQHNAIGRLEEKTATQTKLIASLNEKPKRTPAEQYHYEAAKKALDDFGQHRPSVEALLRLVVAHGTLTTSASHMVVTPMPPGMKIHDLHSYLNGCVETQLLTETLGPNRSGGVMPVHDHLYSIAPAMKTALDELLFQSVHKP